MNHLSSLLLSLHSSLLAPQDSSYSRQAPTTFDPIPFLLGMKGPASCIRFDGSKPATLYLVPRDGMKPVEAVQVDPHFNFHFANAYEDASGNIIFDVVKCSKMTLGDTSTSTRPIWEDIDYGKEVPFSTLSRYTLRRDASMGVWGYTSKDLSSTQVDFTSVDVRVSCRPHRYVYASCGSDTGTSTPVQGVICLDTTAGEEQAWLGERDEFLGECIFVEKEGSKGEGDGYVLTILTNGKKMSSEFLIFDASNVAAGPISRQKLPSFVPHGLHGFWANDLVNDPDEISRKWKAAISIDNKNWNEVKSDFSGLGVAYDL